MDGYMDSCVIKHFSKMLTTILVVDVLSEIFQLYCMFEVLHNEIFRGGGEPSEPS